MPPTITAQISQYPVPGHMIDAAARLVVDGEVSRLGPAAYRVRTYTVTIQNGVVDCTCPSAIRCRHMLAALHVHTEAPE